MLDIFGSVKALLKLEDVRIDNRVFQLHYKLTGAILVAFSLLVTSKQYIGDPIDCVVDEIPQKVMDSYCWIYSTFTVPDQLSGRVGKDVVQPGVGTHVLGEDEVQHHRYYQWVCFTLVFQALLFQLPRYLWKMWEGGLLKKLACDLHGPVIAEDAKQERKDIIIRYFSKKMGHHNVYAYSFFLCEILNFINVVGQIYFMDFFLDGEFSTYGSEVVQFTEMDPETRSDPMSRVFPKVTKCVFNKFGPSGTVQRFDGLCVLPLNIVNEKIYVFLWFWFVILSVVTGLQLVYRLTVIFSSSLKRWLLSRKSAGDEERDVSVIMAKGGIGDWFLLYQMGEVIDPLIYNELVSELSNEIIEKKRSY